MNKGNLKVGLQIDTTVTNLEQLNAVIDELEQGGKNVDELRKKSKKLGDAWGNLNSDEQAQALSRFSKELRKTADSTSLAKRALGALKDNFITLGATLGSVVGFRAIKDNIESLINTGARFEQLRTQLTSLTGSAENAESALSWITDFAKNTPSDIESVTHSFVKMKAFGLDPMDGSFQALIDQTAKLGFSQEKLDGIVLAVGQAWTKQKLQGEEALQLIERGVPVWDLLARATGKNVVELQKLSSAGKLGRNEIRLLINEMGKQSEGAAKSQMSTWNGLVSNLKDTWLNFQDSVAKSGVMDYLKSQLQALSATVSEMATDGRLQQYAERLSNGIVRAAQGFKSFIATLVQLSPVLKTTAELFIGFKLGKLAGSVTNVASAFTGRLLPSITALRTGSMSLKVAMTALTGSMGGLIGLGVSAAIIGIKTAVDALIPKTEAWEYAVRDAKDALVELQTKAIDGIDLNVDAGSLSPVTDAIAEIDAQIADLSDAGTGVIDFAKDLLPLWDTNAEKIIKLTEAKGELIAKQNEVTQTQKRIAETEAKNAEDAKAYAAEQKEAAKQNLEAMKQRKLALEKEGKAYGEYYQYVKQQIAELTETVTGVAPKMTDAFKSVGASINEITTGITDSEQAIINSFSNDIAYIDTISTSAENAGKSIDRYIVSASKKIKTPEGLTAYIAKLEAMPNKSAVVQQELDKLKQQLNMTNPAFAELANSIQKATKVEQLQQFGVAAKKAFDEGKMSAEQYKQALDDIATKSTEISAKNVEASEKSTQAKDTETQAIKTNAEAVKEDTAAKQENNEATRESTSLSIANAEATEVNAEALKQATGSTENYAGSLNNLSLDFGHSTKAAAAFAETVNRFASEGDPFATLVMGARAANEVLDKYRSELSGAVQALDNLNRKSAEGTLTQEDLAEAARYTASQYSVLNDSQLDKINAEVDKARQKLETLEEQAKKTAQSIHDRLLNATGSEEDKINLKYQREKEAIQEKDGGANRPEYQQALNDLEKLRQIELKKLRERKAKEQQRQQEREQPPTTQKELPKKQLADEFNRSFTDSVNQADLSGFIQQLGENAGKQLITKMTEEAKRRAN
ncbi:MAG: tape measure protein [Gammaproteobacteria bacterium]|nr:tape measure protein [Gammaproteobacteria bacterium]